MESMFLGRGWKFPIEPDEKRRLRMCDDEEKVRQSILTILSTSKGERPMVPEFGCGIHDFVFEVINSTVVGLVKASVREALERWEPRIDDLEVSVRAEAEKDAVLLIRVDYRVRTTNTRFNLVYPFYLTESR